MRINKHDINGVKPLLGKGELGYDDYSAGGDSGRIYVGTGTVNIPQAKKAELDAHIVRVDNPHSVTKAQVGLGNVDNTADSVKNVLSATKLTAARTINGVSFDGSTNININTVNSEVIKFDSGITEGTDLYTFNGGVSKTIDIKAGTNVSLTKAAGTITINANDTAVGVTEITGMGTGAATFLTTPTSANLAAMLTDETGSGANVFAVSPTLVTPVLGVATATSINKVSITQPLTGSTLTITDGKTLTASNTLTFTGTDASTVNFGAGGTAVYTSNKLSTLAATTSAELAGVISDETGTGSLVFATNPTLVTPNIGVATGTSFNSITALSSTTPLMDGTAAIGTSTTVARADHVHASDTTKASLSGATFTGAVSGTTFSGTTFTGALSGNAATATVLQTARTIGTSGDVTSTAQSFNGSANVTIPMTLATVTDSGTGTFKKVTVDTKGRVIGTQAVAQTDITGLLGAGSITNAMLANTAVANLSGVNTGDQTITLTGDVTGSGTGSFVATLSNTGVAAGTYSKVTVDAKGRVTGSSTLTMEDIPGAVFKRSVVCATTTALTATYASNVLTMNTVGITIIDGITVALNDRVLIKDQATTLQNGIYTVTTLGTASVATVFTRAADADTITELASALVAVDSGTINGGRLFDNDLKTTDILGTTGIMFNMVVDTGFASTVVGTTPGTAAIGSSTSYARADHVHPVQTTITGNAATATTLQTARTISGVSFNGSANIEIEDRLGTAITSAATVTVGTRGLGDYIHITGTTTITSLGTAAAAGIRRTLIFDGALTLTHNATSLICPGAANIVTVAGTVIEVVAETTTNWRVVSITHPSLSMTEIGYLDGVTSAIQTQIDSKAPLASPALTGTPTSTTATVGTNTTQIATTAFVKAEIANGAVLKVASTDNAIVRFDGTTGVVQNSSITVDDSGNIGSGSQSFNGFGGAGFKNLIINGGFTVFQRGISFQLINDAGPTFVADRWFTSQYGAGGTQNVSVQNASLPGRNSTSLKSIQTTACGNSLLQIIDNDGFGQFARGNKLSISFWYRAKGGLACELRETTTSLASSVFTTNFVNTQGSAIGTASGIVADETWRKCTFTTTSAVNNNGYLHLVFYNTENYAGNYIEIAEVQVECGTVATPFEQRPFALELSLCQRYYRAWRYIGGAQNISTTQLQFTIDHLPYMRTIPTLTNHASGAGSGSIYSTFGSSTSTQYFGANCCVTSGEGVITANVTGLITGVSSISIVGTASAEL